MSEPKNCLFIVEGEVSEKNLIDRYALTLGFKDVNVICMGINIYDFYRKIKELGIENTTTIDVLREMKKGNQKDEKTLNSKIPFIYLVFDFDFQDWDRGDADKRKDLLHFMVNTFDDETEFGLLFINYPMLESYRDFSFQQPLDYKTAFIEKNESKKYKTIVNKRGNCLDITKYNQDKFNLIIGLNIMKLNYLLKGSFSFPDYSSFINDAKQNNILNYELNSLKHSGKIQVLFTLAFLVISYLGKAQFEYYKTLLNNKF